MRGDDQSDFWRYDTATDSWTLRANTPGGVKQGGALSRKSTQTLGFLGSWIYSLRGFDQRDFWRYEVPDNLWTSLQPTPDTVDHGGALAFSGIHIYALRGLVTRDFWRYQIATNVWTSMANTPATVANGGALIFDGTRIYALRGNGFRDFWRYDIDTDTWTSLANTPADVKDGGALIYDDTDIYALRGFDTTDFWRYDIDTDTWTSLANTPAAVKEGGALAFDDTHIYALRGFNTTDFWRYEIATDTWTTLANTPATVTEGGALIFDGSRIYALRGNGTTDFWRYDIITDTWTLMADTLAFAKGGGALTYARIADLVSLGVPTSVVIPPEPDRRFAQGIQLSFTDDEPTNTDVKYQIEYRTGAIWTLIPDSDLPGNSNGFDDSPVDISAITTDFPIIRLRANLSTTGSSIPSIDDWTLTYYVRRFATPEPTGGVLGLEVTLYPTDIPTVEATAATTVSFASISEFFEVSTKNGGEIKYIISNDGGTTWDWWDGLAWVTSNETYSQANAADEVNTNIAAFTSGTFLFRAFARSDGGQLVRRYLQKVCKQSGGVPSL